MLEVEELRRRCEQERGGNQIPEGCRWPDCFHCVFPDCLRRVDAGEPDEELIRGLYKVGWK